MCPTLTFTSTSQYDHGNQSYKNEKRKCCFYFFNYCGEQAWKGVHFIAMSYPPVINRSPVNALITRPIAFPHDLT